MSEDDNGFVLVGGMLFGVFLGYLFGNNFGEEDGFELAIKVAQQCEAEITFSDYERVSECLADKFQMAKEEDYAEGAAQQYP